MQYDVVIIGGGPAGVQAGISCRNTYPDKTILLIRKEKTALIPCGIPYALTSLKSVDEDILADSLLARHRIELAVGEVSGREDKVLSLRDGRHIGFNRLVLATGSVPIAPPIPGIDQQGVHVLSKAYEHLVKLREAIQAAQRVIVVGGGFVGIELADELARAGKTVTLIEQQDEVLPGSIDPEFARPVRQALAGSGVDIITGTALKAFVGKKTLSGADLDNGRWITADLAIVSVGFRPNLTLAAKLGLTIDDSLGVLVNEYLRTSDPDIFAVGDCAAKHNCLTGELQRTMLASTAMAEGRLAGSNVFSINVVKGFAGTLGSLITQVGGLAVGVTGLTEREAHRLGVEYLVGRSEGMDRHPATLPGATRMIVKLLFARYSRILLGAQLCGGGSVGELTNLLSVMIQNKMTDAQMDTLQIGTHPLLTPSPLAYPVISATVDAILRAVPDEARQPAAP